MSYTPSTPMKIEFEDGWYVWITDSNANKLNEHNKDKSEKQHKDRSEMTILTVHGAPGDHR